MTRRIISAVTQRIPQGVLAVTALLALLALANGNWLWLSAVFLGTRLPHLWAAARNPTMRWQAPGVTRHISRVLDWFFLT